MEISRATSDFLITNPEFMYAFAIGMAQICMTDFKEKLNIDDSTDADEIQKQILKNVENIMLTRMKQAVGSIIFRKI